MTRTPRQTSTSLSWLLRHGAGERGIAMDAAGFVAIDDVLRELSIDRATLNVVVSDNAKQRFEVRSDRIRAVQGHSDGTPVTRDGLEASWEVVADDAPVFHGTNVTAATAILDGEGIHAAARSHVHLSPAVGAIVGKRTAVDVLLVVSPRALRAASLTLFRARNGVLLARAVPRATIVDVVAESEAGRRALPALRARLVVPVAPPGATESQ